MTRKSRLIWLMLLQAGLFGASHALAGDDNGTRSFSTGYYYSEGDYTSDNKTRIQALTLGYKLKMFPWTWKINTNLLSIKGPGNITSGEVINLATPARASETDTGFGDTWLSAKYAMRPWNDFSLYTDLGIKLKLPTADEEKGLGTGKADARLQLDLLRPFRSFSLLGYIAWKYRGDPEDFDLNNTAHFSLGLHKPLGPALSAGISYDFSETASDNNEHPREVFTYLSYKFNQQNKMNLYIITGLSDSSPDLASGINFIYSY